MSGSSLPYPFDLSAPGGVDALLAFHRAVFGGARMEADDEDGRTWSAVLDLGNGALGALQRWGDPAAVDVVALSHLHADHVADMPVLGVYRRYRPTGPLPRLTVLGPQGMAQSVIVALRLWNEGGAETRNGAIEAFLHEKCPGEWPEPRGGSFRLRDNLYLERAKKFDWPDLSAQERGTQFCYGLRDQLGVLADGTAVPCCLDHEGDIALGNLFTQPLSEILQSERACALREGFSRRCPSEELCRRCGFAARF